MTSSSELFYNRRSRACRAPDPHLIADPPSLDRDPDLRRRRRRARRGCLHRDDPDHPHPGTPPARHLFNRLSQPEREPLRVDYIGTSEAGTSSNNITARASSTTVNRFGFIRNNRLPGPVLQAQARLLERLRGISLTENRQITTPGIPWNEFSATIDLSSVNSGDWEIGTSNEPYASPFTVTEEDHRFSVQNGNNRKPPGLSLLAFHSLQQVMFKDCDASDAMGASLECAICLERFCEGDQLIQLGCRHKFHPPCLEPWVLACGDCPYCRACI